MTLRINSLIAFITLALASIAAVADGDVEKEEQIAYIKEATGG